MFILVLWLFLALCITVLLIAVCNGIEKEMRWKFLPLRLLTRCKKDRVVYSFRSKNERKFLFLISFTTLFFTWKYGTQNDLTFVGDALKLNKHKYINLFTIFFSPFRFQERCLFYFSNEALFTSYFFSFTLRKRLRSLPVEYKLFAL
jgi:hypothetical protein